MVNCEHELSEEEIQNQDVERIMKIDFKNTYKNIGQDEMFICPICKNHYLNVSDTSEGVLCCHCQDCLTGRDLNRLCRLYRYEYIDFINRKTVPDMNMFCDALQAYKERMKHINRFLINECIESEGICQQIK